MFVYLLCQALLVVGIVPTAVNRTSREAVLDPNKECVSFVLWGKAKMTSRGSGPLVLEGRGPAGCG